MKLKQHNMTRKVRDDRGTLEIDTEHDHGRVNVDGRKEGLEGTQKMNDDLIQATRADLGRTIQVSMALQRPVLRKSTQN